MQNYYKAKRRGLIPSRKSGRTITQSLVHYGREFDIVGVLLISVGLTLCLMPSTFTRARSWAGASPLIIGLLVSGLVLVGLFVAWERYCAPVQFIPYSLLMDRTVFGACILAAVTFASFYIWDAYFPSFLQVVNGLSVTQASYVSQIYSVGCSIWAARRRLPDPQDGSLQVAGALFRCASAHCRRGSDDQVPPARRQHWLHHHVPDLHRSRRRHHRHLRANGRHGCRLAPIRRRRHCCRGYVCGDWRGVGLTVAAGIWQSVFPRKLREYLPVEELKNLDKIYGRLDVQLSYPIGSPARIAIQRAYGDGQKTMLVWGTSVLIIAVIATAAWRDINVKHIKQVKGNVI